MAEVERHSISLGAAHELIVRALINLNVPEQRARIAAQTLVLAEAWNIRSQGLLRARVLLKRIAAGGTRADATLDVAKDRGALVALDGNDGIGYWQLWEAAELVVRRARLHGIAAASVARSSHCGALGAHTIPIVQAGFVALVFSHGPAVMAPWNGRGALLSTSPIAAGIPAPSGPVIVDLATTVASRGEIAARAASGEALPQGWAFGPDGTPTTDAGLALKGTLAPLGGAKGFALAYMIECLVGGLIGPNPSHRVADPLDPKMQNRTQGIGHLVIAIDPTGLDAVGLGENGVSTIIEATVAAGGRPPGATRVQPADIDWSMTVEIPAAFHAELVAAS